MINPIYTNEPIQGINSVRGYTKDQRNRIIQEAEKESQARMETREYLKGFQNPENYSFGELLDQAMGKTVLESEDDGIILDIKN